MSDGDIESWDMQIDHCLGQARRVLEAVTESLLVEKDMTEEAVAGSVTIAEAWRDLAEAWRNRQATEMAMGETDEAEDEEEAEPVSARNE